MPHDPPTADEICNILDELAEALTSLQGQHNENDRPALELIEMAGIDVQDIIDTLDNTPSHPLFCADGELSAIAAWLASYRSGQPALVSTLTTLVDDAAAKISNLGEVW